MSSLVGESFYESPEIDFYRKHLELCESRFTGPTNSMER